LAIATGHGPDGEKKMSKRVFIRRLHLAAGILVLLTILTFWISTVVTEVFGGHAAVAAVKTGILWGMIVLIPAMAIVGGSGFFLGGASRAPLVAAKRRRMPIIALNGLLVLVPSAVFLAGRAGAGQFDLAFYTVQMVELAAGALNIWLMALNMRDGLSLSATFARRRIVTSTTSDANAPIVPAAAAPWRRS
jgi:hypothetical protein